MTKKAETTTLGRRDFFRKAGIGAGVVGAAAVGLKTQDGEAAVADGGRRDVGYQETQHVKKFYQLARF